MISQWTLEIPMFFLYLIVDYSGSKTSKATWPWLQLPGFAAEAPSVFRKSVPLTPAPKHFAAWVGGVKSASVPFLRLPCLEAEEAFHEPVDCRCFAQT